MVASHLTSDLTGHCHQYVFHAIELSFDLSTWAGTVCAPGPCEKSEELWMRGYGANVDALPGSTDPCLYRAITAIAVAYTSDVAAG